MMFAAYIDFDVEVHFWTTEPDEWVRDEAGSLYVGVGFWMCLGQLITLDVQRGTSGRTPRRRAQKYWDRHCTQ